MRLNRDVEAPIMRLLVILLLVATLARAQSTSSPRKFFAYSLSNSRGPNLIRGYSFFYVSSVGLFKGLSNIFLSSLTVHLFDH